MTSAETTLGQLFEAAGTAGWLHARDLACASTALKNPAADAVIGAAAPCAVDLLRGVPAS